MPRIFWIIYAAALSLCAAVLYVSVRAFIDTKQSLYLVFIGALTYVACNIAFSPFVGTRKK